MVNGLSTINRALTGLSEVDMGDPKGFLKIKRQNFKYRSVCDRVKDFKEIPVICNNVYSQEQASRCMDCGVPFCHWGCPISNIIPNWNDLVFHGKWEKAFELLQETNNFPEFTGRLCPAICEASCVLGLNDDPVTIRENELAIIEYAFKHGFVKPYKPKKRTGKKVAIIGSGPSGLACADELNKMGHSVTVFEKDEKIGGVLRYGIPDFKLEKWVIDRRLDIMTKEGIVFKCNTNVGIDIPVLKLKNDYDAICLAVGSSVPRDLSIEGRNLNGIYFAMDYLIQANKINAAEKIDENKIINVFGKNVVVIGGGDTGADCVGVSNRCGAKKIVQIELMPKPSSCRTNDMPWPKYPMLLKTSSSHEEGCERYWAILTKRFIGEKGYVKKISCVKIEFKGKDAKGCPLMSEIADSEFEINADIVILAMGFLYPNKNGLLQKLNLDCDLRGNVKTDKNNMTSGKGVFAAGDMRRGQSLIVWGILEGRQTAKAIDSYLKNC